MTPSKSNYIKLPVDKGAPKAELSLPIPSANKNIPEEELTKLSKDSLNQLVDGVTGLFRRSEATCGPDSSRRLSNLVKSLAESRKTQLEKPIAADLYRSFSESVGNIAALAHISKPYREAWEEMLGQFVFNSDIIEKHLGAKMYAASYYKGWYSHYMPEALFFPLSIEEVVWKDPYSQGADYMLYIAPGERRQLATQLMGASATEPILRDTPPPGLQTEDFEPDMATDVAILGGVALNGDPLTSTGVPGTTQLNKLRKNCTIEEFKTYSGNWPLNRLALLLTAYFTDKGSGSREAITPATLARFAVKKMAKKISGKQLELFIPEVKGFTRLWADSPLTATITERLERLLMPAESEWMSMENFRMRLLCDSNGRQDLQNDLMLFDYDGRRKCKAIWRDEKRKGYIQWFDDMAYPFALNWIKFLSGLGILETATDTTLKNPDSDPLRGLRWVRMTALGHYAFGLTESYAPPRRENDGMELEYDSENGIFTLSEKSPLALFLSTVCEKISPVRFRFNMRTLLKGCANESELFRRIDSLKAVVDVDGNPAIDAVVAEALGRTDCAEREDGYSLFKIRDNLPDMRQAILANKELRAIARFAEGGMVLVKTSDLDRFHTLCAREGYLLT